MNNNSITKKLFLCLMAVLVVFSTIFGLTISLQNDETTSDQQQSNNQETKSDITIIYEPHKTGEEENKKQTIKSVKITKPTPKKETVKGLFELGGFDSTKDKTKKEQIKGQSYEYKE